MKDAYTKLMVQQHTSPDGDAFFFEKLENRTQKKRKPVLKAAMVAVCICLIITGCVWAAIKSRSREIPGPAVFMFIVLFEFY